jgi:hypothetical protein
MGLDFGGNQIVTVYDLSQTSGTQDMGCVTGVLSHVSIKHFINLNTAA